MVKKQSGSLILSVLLVTFLMATLLLFFLGRWQRDFSFQTRQEAAEQAYQLARSGVEYYRSRPLPVSDIEHIPFPQSAPAIISLSSYHRFRVYGVDAIGTSATVNSAGGVPLVVGTNVGTTIHSIGEVLDAQGNVVLRREIVVPESVWGQHYVK